MVIYLFEDLDFQNVRMLCVASAYSKYVLYRYDLKKKKNQMSLHVSVDIIYGDKFTDLHKWDLY